jgi:hypothetical protein
MLRRLLEPKQDLPIDVALEEAEANELDEATGSDRYVDGRPPLNEADDLLGELRSGNLVHADLPIGANVLPCVFGLLPIEDVDQIP